MKVRKKLDCLNFNKNNQVYYLHFNSEPMSKVPYMLVALSYLQVSARDKMLERYKHSSLLPKL